jgi:hypothetical protein
VPETNGAAALRALLIVRRLRHASVPRSDMHATQRQRWRARLR